MKNHATTESAARSNSAVTATAMLSQKNGKNTTPTKPSSKTYRRSSVSTTIRVPNSLLREVKALISASRQGKRNDPDSWD
jgi:predicted DNA binding CopG/RHH family protein